MGKNEENQELAPSEAAIQQQIVVWYWNTYCLAHLAARSLILSIPNEGNPRLAALGVRAGASDTIAFHRPFVGDAPLPVFLEVKTPKGRQRPNQAAFEAHVKGMGMEYVICRSLEDAKAFFDPENIAAIRMRRGQQPGGRRILKTGTEVVCCGAEVSFRFGDPERAAAFFAALGE